MILKIYANFLILLRLPKIHLQTLSVSCFWLFRWSLYRYRAYSEQKNKNENKIKLQIGHLKPFEDINQKKIKEILDFNARLGTLNMRFKLFILMYAKLQDVLKFPKNNKNQIK